MDCAGRLRKHVEYLALDVGERSPRQYQNLEEARRYIESEFIEQGYQVEHDVFQVFRRTYRNVIVEKTGDRRPDEILLIGAHYDTVPGTPGADDNASGVACLLEIARALRSKTSPLSLRFAAFTLEEPPYFRTSSMGSLVHATRCREKKENIVGMASLEMVGYYSNREHSQGYPLPFMRWFYPSKGNFIAIAGNFRSRRLVRKLKRRMAETSDLPVESTALPFVPGAGLSDNWSFWKQRYRAVMITDTSFFRNPHYHLPSDHPQTLDYDRMSSLVESLIQTVVNF